MKSQLAPGVMTMIVSGVFFFALLIAYVVAAQTDEIVTAWAGDVALEAEDGLAAGTATSVTVTADAVDGTEVIVAVFAPASTNVFPAVIENGTATIDIAPLYTEHSGLYRIIAEVDGSPSQLHELTVTPLEAVDPVVPLVGPRTIIADGSDFTMTVVSPTDRFGNPVVDGTVVDFDLLRPDGERTIVPEPVDRAISAILIESTTETGRMVISSSVGATEGPSNVVDQVAGVPAPFTVEADERNTLADGFTLHQVQTSELRDVFGNLLPDGVAAVFVVDDGTGISFVNSTVQGGFARAGIESPAEPLELTVSARVSGAESSPLVMQFDPAVVDVPVDATRFAAGTDLTIGPVLTERGGYVPDGTTVVVTDLSTGRPLAEMDLRGGVVDIELDGVTGPIEVTVLGASAVVSAS